jgi:hypothetical protein
MTDSFHVVAIGGGEQRALWNKLDTIRHDPQALGATLLELLAK